MEHLTAQAGSRGSRGWTEAELVEQVAAAERNARQRARYLAGMERAAQDNPRQWLPFLWSTALSWSRWWRRYLRSSFGYDVVRLRPTDSRRILALTEHEWGR